MKFRVINVAREGGIFGLFVDANLIPEQVSITVHISK